MTEPDEVSGQQARIPLRPERPLYAAVALAYLSSGLGAPLPLPPRRKHPPPRGYTGRWGDDPTASEVKRWMRTRKPRSNVALRVPPDVLALDVDAYGHKQGDLTLGRLEDELGPLPPTLVCTSRPGSISGIRFFRVPPDMYWIPTASAVHEDGARTAHVDVIQHRHRYAVVAPSVHPEGREYIWLGMDGELLNRVPKVEELAELPRAWVEYLTLPEPTTFSATTRASDVANDKAADVPARAHTRGGQSALTEACRVIRLAPIGERNDLLNRLTFELALLWTEGQVEAADAKARLLEAAGDAGVGQREANRTIRSAWSAGLKGRRE